MVTHLEVDLGEAKEKIITTRGAHAQFSFLKDSYKGI